MPSPATARVMCAKKAWPVERTRPRPLRWPSGRKDIVVVSCNASTTPRPRIRSTVAATCGLRIRSGVTSSLLKKRYAASSCESSFKAPGKLLPGSAASASTSRLARFSSRSSPKSAPSNSPTRPATFSSQLELMTSFNHTRPPGSSPMCRILRRPYAEHRKRGDDPFRDAETGFSLPLRRGARTR